MRICNLFLVMLLLYPIIGSAGIYKYTDKDGVASFTDDLRRVPEEQRQKAEEILIDSPSGSMPSQIEKGSPFYKWMHYHAFKIIFVLILLIVSAYIAQRVMEGLLLRFIIRLLIISLLGATIYAIFTTQKERLAPGSLEKTVEPYLPSPAPINRTIENVKKFEEGQKKKEEMLDSLKDSGGN